MFVVYLYIGAVAIQLALREFPMRMIDVRAADEGGPRELRQAGQAQLHKTGNYVTLPSK